MEIMNIAIIGLGRIGGAVLQRLHKASFPVIGFDVDKHTRDAFQLQGIKTVDSLKEVGQIAHVIFIYIPAGALVDQVLNTLVEHVAPHAIIIDGGNSKFTDSIARAQTMATHNIVFLDCGTSGGIHGQEIGFSLMVGGHKEAYNQIEHILQAIAAPNGLGYMGPSGTGHYVKMIHNGIEYALLQAYAEGLEIIKDGHFKSDQLDLETITRVWSHGSIIRSWILELLHTIVTENKTIDSISGKINESGTGAWTVEEAKKYHIPATVIEQALHIRAQSRENGGSYATKLVALLRHAFGGHAVECNKEKK